MVFGIWGAYSVGGVLGINGIFGLCFASCGSGVWVVVLCDCCSCAPFSLSGVAVALLVCNVLVVFITFICASGGICTMWVRGLNSMNITAILL